MKVTGRKCDFYSILFTPRVSSICCFNIVQQVFNSTTHPSSVYAEQTIFPYWPMMRSREILSCLLVPLTDA